MFQVACKVTIYPTIPGIKWFTDSRLIIVAHGNPESTFIMGDNIQWDAKTLATNVKGWLNNAVIGRISLHMCMGSGNRGAATGTNFANFTVHPTRSFAYSFASHCNFATSITARTERTTVQIGGDHGTRRVVGPPGQKVHQGPGDKIVFLTQGGTPNQPQAPITQPAY